jgi:hypothetical protein
MKERSYKFEGMKEELDLRILKVENVRKAKTTVKKLARIKT